MYNPQTVKNILTIDSMYGENLRGEESIWFQILDHKDTYIRTQALCMCYSTFNLEDCSPTELIKFIPKVLLKLQSNNNFFEECMIKKIISKFAKFTPITSIICSKLVNYKKNNVMNHKLVFEPSTFIDKMPVTKQPSVIASDSANPAISILKHLCIFI
jgi:hypothetical protein